MCKKDRDWTPQPGLAIESSWARPLNSSLQAEVRMELKKRSDLEAIQVFRENLHNLLLALSLKHISEPPKPS